MLRRRYDSMDVAQSVFAEVLRDLPRLEDRGERAFCHWLYIKAENKIRGKLRRHLGADRSREEQSEHSVTERTSLAPSPGTHAHFEEDRARLDDLLAGLGDRDREVVRLRTERGMAFAQIAQTLSLPSADAARMRYARVVTRLRGRWGPT